MIFVISAIFFSPKKRELTTASHVSFVLWQLAKQTWSYSHNLTWCKLAPRICQQFQEFFFSFKICLFWVFILDESMVESGVENQLLWELLILLFECFCTKLFKRSSLFAIQIYWSRLWRLKILECYRTCAYAGPLPRIQHIPVD